MHSNRHGNPHRDDAHLYQRMKQLSNRSPIVSQLAAGIKPRTRPWVVQHATTRLSSPRSNCDTTETNDIEWKMSEKFKGINIDNFYQKYNATSWKINELPNVQLVCTCYPVKCGLCRIGTTANKPIYPVWIYQLIIL